MEPSPHRSRGYVFAFASALVLCTTALFIRYLTLAHGMPVLALAFWRDLLVAMVLGIVFALRARRRFRVGRRELLFLGAHGMVLAGFNIALTASVAENGASVSTVLVYSSAAFTALLGWLFLRERTGTATLLAVGVCFLGCALTGGPSAGDWRWSPAGLAAGLLSGLGYAAYTVMGRRAALRGIDPWTTLFYTFGTAAAYLLAVNFAISGWNEGWRSLWHLQGAWTGWAMLFILAAGPTVAGFGLYNVSLTILPSATVNLIVSIEPAITLLAAYVLLGEALAPLQIAGAGLILLVVVLLRIRDRSTAAMADPASA